MLVYCGQTVGWIKMKLGMEVGLDRGHIVLDGDPAPTKGAQPPAIFGPFLLLRNAWIKMPLGTEVDLGPAHIVLNRDPAPLFSAHVYCGQTVAHLTYC